DGARLHRSCGPDSGLGGICLRSVHDSGAVRGHRQHGGHQPAPERDRLRTRLCRAARVARPFGVQRRLLHAFTVSLDASYARGSSQYGFRDVNLVATPRFTLPDEAGRPVYVPADSIVPGTGALGFTASRVHPEFGEVLVIGSDLQSDTRQVTLGVGAGTTRGAALRLSYTF